LRRIRISGETARRIRETRWMSRMQDAAAMVMLAPVLSPHGVLTLVRSREVDAALVLEVERGVRLEQAFARGCGHGRWSWAPTRSARHSLQRYPFGRNSGRAT
jgi:hypothetical protein